MWGTPAQDPRVPQLIMIDFAGRPLRKLPFERGAGAAALLEWEEDVDNVYDRWPKKWPPDPEEIKYVVFTPTPADETPEPAGDSRSALNFSKRGKRRRRKGKPPPADEL